MTDKPHYYTVNITVEDENGEQLAVWRSTAPYRDVEVAMERATQIVVAAEDETPVDFDRMDD